MNSEKNKISESTKRGLIAVIILLLAPLFKNFDWERLQFTECNESVTSEQSFDYSPIKKVKRPRQTELTFVTLKQYNGFENINEVEAEKHIEFIQRMAKVMYYMTIDEQKQNT